LERKIGDNRSTPARIDTDRETTERKMEKDSTLQIDPLTIIRYEDGHRVFGYKPTQLAEQIKLGTIPTPKYLGAPPSRAKGWTGQQVIQYFRDLDDAQAERAAAAKKVYDAKVKPGQRKETEAAATAKPKVKKLRLRKPGR
jgi:hypothetical protein